MAKSNPARAKKLDVQRPLYEVPKQLRKSNGGPSPRSVASKIELAALREEVRSAASTVGGRRDKALQLALGQVEARFGQDEWKKMIQELHITYKGVANVPVNVQLGAGPVQ